ncbi:hypothetical protein [Corynebacterium pseudodiphtheriticum]|uniref:Triphosphate Pyrophosphohydrolase n=1 Tax=Siphoviridae sp. ctGkF2 TaxID=2827823 RepID=A0A8S5TL26_9CAUD|nr:hypothetical protein [Corynebacterium pseudodiphtheriticum]MDK4206954.1 hypothetical protein [Corynebacterium pseudodiphtheriticum]DAF64014.1 MAG TPA: Triphosphate Pyrophosphohydrolase [Siphoviridae sp. ctGkF2]
MKYTLENVTTDLTPESPYGTCDLCMSTAPYEEVVYHLEDENGKGYFVSGSLIDYDSGATPLPDVENVIHFADWLKDQEVEDEMGYETLRNLIHRYHMIHITTNVHPIDTVAQFMFLAGQLQEDHDTDLNSFVERVDEESMETEEAVYEDDEAGILDGFLDIAYAALTGAVAAAGGPMEARMAWDAVVDANLSKVDGRLGPVRKSASGKVLKPEGFVAPDIQKILDDPDEVYEYERAMAENSASPYKLYLARKGKGRHSVRTEAS